MSVSCICTFLTLSRFQKKKSGWTVNIWWEGEQQTTHTAVKWMQWRARIKKKFKKIHKDKLLWSHSSETCGFLWVSPAVRRATPFLRQMETEVRWGEGLSYMKTSPGCSFVTLTHQTSVIPVLFLFLTENKMRKGCNTKQNHQNCDRRMTMKFCTQTSCTPAGTVYLIRVFPSPVCHHLGWLIGTCLLIDTADAACCWRRGGPSKWW